MYIDFVAFYVKHVQLGWKTTFQHVNPAADLVLTKHWNHHLGVQEIT